MISVVVLTKNEEKNIKDCLKSLQWCDEVIVIDDYSTDKTLEIIQKSKVKIFQRKLNGDFTSQRNYGLEKAKGEWVLFVDADERVTPALREEIIKLSNYPIANYNGFYLKRQDYFGGRWLKHGETANIKLLRLARKNSGQWQRKVHEVWEIKGKINELKNPILHYPHQTISEFLSAINDYSTLHAQVLLEEGRRPSLLRIIFNPLGKFLQNYLLKLGFLDGMPGLIMALMMSFHSFLARTKLWKKF